MTGYHKNMTLFSYLFGFVALIAILADRKEDKLYTFHVWQAFLLNLFLLLIMMLFYLFFVPDYIFSMEVDARASFFLKITLVPLFMVPLSLLVLGVMSYTGIKFRIPLIGSLALSLSRYKGK